MQNEAGIMFCGAFQIGDGGDDTQGVGNMSYWGINACGDRNQGARGIDKEGQLVHHAPGRTEEMSGASSRA